MKPLAILLTAISLLAGCGDEEATPPERPAGDGPLVSFARTGGFAPQPYSLEVDREGGATLTLTTRQDKDKTKRFTLSADDRSTLTDALDAVRDAGEDGRNVNAGCADCFYYSVKADGIDLELDSFTYTDDATPEAQVALVAILEELVGRES